MPKKPDKKKKKVVKRATAVPRAKKNTKPKSAAPTIIYRTIREKGCCTDVLKTGQAYVIPFGFRDVKGTQRIDEEPKPLSVVNTLGRATKIGIPMETQTDPIRKADEGNKTAISVKRKPNVPIEIETEQQPFKSLNEMTKKELQDKCRSLGLYVPKSANKAYLQEKLQNFEVQRQLATKDIFGGGIGKKNV